MIVPVRLQRLDTPSLLRLGVLGLALFGIVGTTIELVFLEHWDGLTQQIVWPALLTLVVAFGLIAWHPTRRRVRIGQALAAAVLVVAALGIWFHVQENLGAGPLDRAYAATWDARSPVEQWWLAATGQVGPAPTLAPGVLAQISFALLLATVRLPLSPTDR